MAGSLPAFSATTCYLAHFSSYPDGCVCYIVGEFSAFSFIYDPNDPSYNDAISYCHSNLASQDVVFDCSVDGSSVSCTRISDNTGGFSLPVVIILVLFPFLVLVVLIFHVGKFMISRKLF
jgi:hypothetical protein